MLNFSLLSILIGFAIGVGFFLSFIFFVYITRGRRPVSNIITWLSFIFFMPYLGIPLFLLFGQRKLSRVLDRKRLNYPEHYREFKTVASGDTLFNVYGILPPTYHNSIEFLMDGVLTYETLMQCIREAEDSIFISTYLLKNDAVGRAIVDLLTKKAKAGVQVCLLIDTIGNLFYFPRRKFQLLRKAGGEVRYFMSFLHATLRGQINLRNHRKIMIFDGKKAIIGGINLAREYMGPTPFKNRWIDLSMVVKGETVNESLMIFESDWEYATAKVEKKEYVRPTVAHKNEGTSIIQVLASGPDTIGDSLYDTVISAIYTAEKSIYIVTPYFVIDDALQKALMIAVRRGIDVNIVIPRKSNHPVTDFVRSISVRKLYDEGAKIWLVPKMNHAKLMLFDHKMAVVGSANMDMRSLLLNFEISCLIYEKNDLDQLQKWVDDLILTCNNRIKKSSMLRMLIEDAAQILKPLL